MMNYFLQMMNFFICHKDIDELFRLTEKSFRNLIREDEQQQIESSIWEQIDKAMKMTIFTFIFEKLTELIFLFLIMEEL